METRRFGRTEHMSSVAIFGGFALSSVTQEEADKVMELVIQAGVNHLDVAPSYGSAEERLGPWVKRERQRFFLGCKTMQRARHAAADELHASLKRLQTDHFDLYQLHAITTFAELDEATRPGGALEALVEARHAGLARYLGITGHGVQTPAIFIEALQRFDFDSVIFPVNFIQYAEPAYREKAAELIQLCRQRDAGIMAIKSITKGPWGDRPHTHNTWYEPFTASEQIQAGVNFALSQPVTGLCTAGDAQVLPLMLEACEHFTPLSAAQQEELIDRGGLYEPLFT